MSAEQPTWDQRIEALRRKYDDLQKSIGMDDVTRELGNIATEIAGLPGEIAGLRERGYAFAGYLERKADVLNEQWDAVQQEVRSAVRQEVARVQGAFGSIGELWTKLDSQWSDKGKEQVHDEIQRVIAEVEGTVSAARSRIEGMYGEVPGNVSQTQSQIKLIERYLAQAAEATVDWKPTEAIYMVHEGEWVQSGKGKEDPDGMLYLTDQRLIFEQKEKVGGRFGFGGEKVQQVLFEVPVGAISEVKAEDKGLFGGKDLIHLTMSSGDYAETTFEVKSGGIDSKWYAGQLNRVITGEIDKERAIPVDEAAAEAVSSAPTACPTCGATFPPITRGMTEMTCQYCGTVVRL